MNYTKLNLLFLVCVYPMNRSHKLPYSSNQQPILFHYDMNAFECHLQLQSNAESGE